jgi:2-hydroxy-3-oxopropionate reductase
MGSPMTRNILRGAPPECDVMIYGRTSTRLADLAEAGANIMSNPRELTAASDVVLVMLPDLPQIEEILTGDDGILAGVTERKTLVVGSSVSPAGLRALAARLTRQTRGLLRVVDAPVSGGVEGAAAATLSIMVGGAAEDVRVVWPILTTMGTPVHLGHLGSGQVAKACNQLIVAATMTTIAESAVIAKRAGLNVDSFLTVLRGGYAGSRVLETKQQKVVERDYRQEQHSRHPRQDVQGVRSGSSWRVTGWRTRDQSSQSREGGADQSAMCGRQPRRRKRDPALLPVPGRPSSSDTHRGLTSVLELCTAFPSRFRIEHEGWAGRRAAATGTPSGSAAVYPRLMSCCSSASCRRVNALGPTPCNCFNSASGTLASCASRV